MPLLLSDDDVARIMDELTTASLLCDLLQGDPAAIIPADARAAQHNLQNIAETLRRVARQQNTALTERLAVKA